MKPHTGQDEHDSSAQGDLVFGVLGGSADLGALESQHRDDDGGHADQQGQDHQSSAGLQVSWTHHTPERKTKCLVKAPHDVGEEVWWLLLWHSF